MDITKLLSAMTLEEKASLCSGLDFWHLKGIEHLNIPSIMVADGPHGLRKQEDSSDHLGIYESNPSTCFPTAVGMASSWNRELIEKVGIALGKECHAEGVSILLGPGVNIKRSPLGGRNFEYFSEDPYLTAEMATSHIEGVQSEGIGTSLKHFAVNNQEERRMTIDAIIDERTLREVYLPGFEIPIKKAQPWTVMSAYNKVNGEYASENEYLLNDILREEWGFEGFVVSDWGAVNEMVASIASGMELEMPPSGGVNEKKIIEAINSGQLTEEKLDEAVRRILNIILKAMKNKKDNYTYDVKAHHQLARKVASESIVLLKNESNILPLQREGKLGIIGEFAKNPRFQGGGSSHVNPTKLENSYDEIMNIVKDDTEVLFSAGYDLRKDEIDEDLVDDAVKVAQEVDKVVLFVGLPDRYESEGYDRTHLNLPESHDYLVEKVAEVNPNLVIVLSNGSPVEMPWINKVKGIIESYLGGQAVGGAIADILFGITNPSGKLAETFPEKLEDNPSYLNFPGDVDKVEYREGVFVGYRYYDTKNVKPLFPFGHGLSYTQFEYSQLSMNKNFMLDNETLTVTVKVKNTGNVQGKEIVQLYVRDIETSVSRPDKELKGFEKVDLQPGKEKTVTFSLDKRAFAYYNEKIQDWHVETGDFEIIIGKSSQDLVLKDVVHVESTTKLPKWIDRNTMVGDILANPVLHPVLMKVVQEMDLGDLFEEPDESQGEDAAIMAKSMLMNAPLRLIINFGQGQYNEEMLTQFISLLNTELKKQEN